MTNRLRSVPLRLSATLLLAGLLWGRVAEIVDAVRTAPGSTGVAARALVARPSPKRIPAHAHALFLPAAPVVELPPPVLTRPAADRPAPHRLRRDVRLPRPDLPRGPPPPA